MDNDSTTTSTSNSSSKLLGLSWLDLSTGEFQMSSSSYSSIHTDLSRLSPNELLLSEQLSKDPQLAKIFKDYYISIQPTEDINTSYKSAMRSFRNIYKVDKIEDLIGLSNTSTLANSSSNTSFSRIEVCAGGMLLRYIENTQIDKVPHLSLPQRFSTESTMRYCYS